MKDSEHSQFQNLIKGCKMKKFKDYFNLQESSDYLDGFKDKDIILKEIDKIESKYEKLFKEIEKTKSLSNNYVKTITYDVMRKEIAEVLFSPKGKFPNEEGFNYWWNKNIELYHEKDKKKLKNFIDETEITLNEIKNFLNKNNIKI